MCNLFGVQVTLTELRRATSRVLKVADREGEVIITQHWRPAYRLTPYTPAVVFDDADRMRAGELSDADILQAVQEAREDMAKEIASIR